jgi:8-oxo-dGTP diphosphatase
VAVETRFEIENMGREMARAPVLAAGGIVLRQEETPLIAVVRLRKRNEWVLPKGKLDDGETPRDAAEREVLEETGHDVSVHEFLGTLVYESGGRSKVVHYWRMETSGEPSHELMDDVRAVDWLPLDAAVERLSRSYERAFLANVGPLALEAAASADTARRPKAKPPVREKRRGRQVVVAQPSLTKPMPGPPQPDPVSPATGQDEHPFVGSDVVEAETSVHPTEFGMVAPPVEADSAAPPVEREADDTDTAEAAQSQRRNLVQKVRDWLRRAA